MSISSVINSHVVRLPVIVPKPAPSGGVGVGVSTPIAQPAGGGNIQSTAPVSPVSSSVMSVLLSAQSDPSDSTGEPTSTAPAAAVAPTAQQAATSVAQQAASTAANVGHNAAPISIAQTANGQGTAIGGSQARPHHHRHAGSIDDSQTDSSSDMSDSTDASGASTDAASGDSTMSTLSSVLDTLEGAATIAALA